GDRQQAHPPDRFVLLRRKRRENKIPAIVEQRIGIDSVSNDPFHLGHQRAPVERTGRESQQDRRREFGNSTSQAVFRNVQERVNQERQRSEHRERKVTEN